ncbi:serine/threonine protein kinase [Paenibacillus beijingensis]|uniref:serine/threonine protein kinase n=1 Tax=Paenibacillus beijingensis TaxID=1126833 RepID=UPI000ABE6BA4|nr:serine/threonine-protein kinase [Paenibacillus beijingensis]
MNHDNREWSRKQRLLDIGTLVGGRYRISCLIGQGGMGRVYAAEDLRLQGKLRALKTHAVNLSDRSGCAEEAELLMRLSHPHLPHLLDYFPPDEDGMEIMVMDYIDGVTLEQRFRASGGAVPLKEALSIALQLCGALTYLHRQHPPIVHRDLKPSNIMIDSRGNVRLIDFGIARTYKDGSLRDTALLGTPGFAAPEQAGEGQSDERTDVYGLGALLVYLLSGGRHYRAEDGDLCLPGIPQPLNDVLETMVAGRKELRYRTMEEAERELRKWYDPATEAERRPRKWYDSGTVADRGQSAKRILPGHIAAEGAITAPTAAVASISPGAGATFIAITLAHMLADKRIPCAAVEAPVCEPEWYALLSGDRHSPPGGHPSEADSRYAGWKNGGVTWKTLLPHARQTDSRDDDLKFRLLAAGLREAAAVVDYSSRWLGGSGRDGLLASDLLVVVADPNPARWTIERMRVMRDLVREREQAGRQTVWIANKDAAFPQREQWLRLLPSAPAAVVPHLPTGEWNRQLWSGGWLNDAPKLYAPVGRALGRVTGLIVDMVRKQQTETPNLR